MKISVIIPAYNAADTIQSCIESVMAACSDLNKEAVEVICINDGSTDTTAEKLNQLAEQYCTLRVIHKPNGGASSARNSGLAAAQGEYIMFCDADDRYEDATIDYILDDIKQKPDYIVFQRRTVALTGSSFLWARSTGRGDYNHDGVKYMNETIIKDSHSFVVFNKVYRKALIEEYSLRFDTSLLFGEDVLFNMLYLSHCQRLSYDFRACYRQIKREGSITTKKRMDFFEQNLKCMEVLQSSYSDLATVLQPFVAYYYVNGAVLAASRILSGRDGFKGSKRSAIRRIFRREDVKQYYRSMTSNPYLKHKASLLMKGLVGTYVLRYNHLPELKKRIKSALRHS